MGVFKKLKSLFPIPTAWQQVDEKKKFCLRAEEAYRWLQMELGNVKEEKAGSIELLSTDDTWDKIWAKVNTMEINKTYALFCHGTPAAILSSNVRSNSLAGTITRVQDGRFLLTVRIAQSANGFATVYWDGVSSASRGTYTENSKIDSSAIKNTLDITESGYVLDARAGKELNDKITKRGLSKSSVPASSSNNIPLESGSRYFLICCSAASTTKCAAIVSTSNTGAVGVYTLGNPSNLTFDTSTANVLKITNGSTINLDVFLEKLQ